MPWDFIWVNFLLSSSINKTVLISFIQFWNYGLPDISLVFLVAFGMLVFMNFEF